MALYECPSEIVEAFANADEQTKSAARAAAYEWAMSLDLFKGDIVLLPHPDTGALMETRFDGPPSIQ